ncbi:unnamed protein product [Pocillopora meandrina]|uniref:Kinesin light chain n=1 Tax=Pocillopora meandrina TaxID=46732 RepID=A0AAU9WXJ7_9CNID|nr:unnamed protein product [Pocillopora meandrina]
MRCHTASSFDSDDGDPQRYGAFGDAQQVQLLHLLIDTAAREGAQQFIEMIFSTSAGRLVFDASKDSRSLPEVVARYHGHNKTACYLEGVTKRFSVEISATKECPKKINWSELAQAAAGEAQSKHAKSGDEEDFRGMPSHKGDTSSDYFADARTSSCGSFEVDSGRSDSEAGSKDKEPEKELTRNAALSSGTFTKDREPTEKESPTLTPPVEPSSNETTQFDQAEDEEKTHFRSSRFHMFKSLIPTYFSHGVTKHASGDLSSALQSKQCALDIRVKLFGEEDPDTAQSYFSHGVTQHASGDLLSALQFFQRALDIRVKIFGEEHPDTARSYLSLGVTQHASGKLSSALKSLQRALDIRVKIFGEEHPYTSHSYFRLGVTQHDSGDLSSALQSLQRALDIRVKIFGEEHADTAQSYQTLGVTQYASGDLSSARQSKQRALDIRVKLSGEDHPDIAESYFSLGVKTQDDSGDLSSALQSCQRALDIRSKIFGEDHPDTAQSYLSLGVTQHDSGKLSSALKSLQRALDIRVKLFGEEHPATAKSHFSPGVTQHAPGDPSSAL